METKEIKVPDVNRKATREEREMKRKIVKRNNLIFLTVIICISLFLGACFGIFISNKKAEKEAEKYEYYIRSDEVELYTGWTVHHGDTLTSISKKICKVYNMEFLPWQVELAEIVSINKICPDEIKSGQTLVVPYIHKLTNQEKEEFQNVTNE